MSSTEWDAAKLQGVRHTLRSRLLQPLSAGGHEPVDIQVDEVAAVRYRGQSYAIEIACPDFANPAGLGRAFLDRHEELYGFATDEDWELVSIRQRASIPRTALLAGSAIPARARPAPHHLWLGGRRRVRRQFQPVSTWGGDVGRNPARAERRGDYRGRQRPQ